MAWYVLLYQCPYCKKVWSDEWDCICNSRCPECNKEIEPLEYDEVTEERSEA